MRIRTSTCNFRPVKIGKGIYFITLKDDRRIECFVTLLQIDFSSFARKRNNSNTLFLGTDIYNGAATISITRKVDKSTSRRPSNWHNDNLQWPPSYTLTCCHATAKCLLVECKPEGNCLLLFVGNATLTTVKLDYSAITTHILTWWYETENKNNHYHNHRANYVPLSKNLWIIYCIILQFRKLSNTSSLVVLEWNISKDFGRAYAPLQRKCNHKIMNYSKYVSVSMWWHIFMSTQHTKT